MKEKQKLYLSWHPTGYDKNADDISCKYFDNIGIVLNSRNRRRLKELLEETTGMQSEELQAQHSELENLNAELEAQAEKLQDFRRGS